MLVMRLDDEEQLDLSRLGWDWTVEEYRAEVAKVIGCPRLMPAGRYVAMYYVSDRDCFVWHWVDSMIAVDTVMCTPAGLDDGRGRGDGYAHVGFRFPYAPGRYGDL